MKLRTLILIGTALLANHAKASIMSLEEAKDKLAVIQSHEAQAKQDYLNAKHAYNSVKSAKRAAKKEVKAIAVANAKSVAAEQASTGYYNTSHSHNPYLDQQYLGSGNVNLKGYRNEYTRGL